MRSEAAGRESWGDASCQNWRAADLKSQQRNHLTDFLHFSRIFAWKDRLVCVLLDMRATQHELKEIWHDLCFPSQIAFRKDCLGVVWPPPATTQQPLPRTNPGIAPLRSATMPWQWLALGPMKKTSGHASDKVRESVLRPVSSGLIGRNGLLHGGKHI